MNSRRSREPVPTSRRATFRAPLLFPNRLCKAISHVKQTTYTRSYGSRPNSSLSYEQMFPSSRTTLPAQRMLGALRLIRSFLLLEDDYGVDWEVDRNEPGRTTHPHRVPLGGRFVPRRPGEPTPTPLSCLSPVAVSPGKWGDRPRRPSETLLKCEIAQKI
jgi:hypothetical protein